MSTTETAILVAGANDTTNLSRQQWIEAAEDRYGPSTMA